MAARKHSIFNTLEQSGSEVEARLDVSTPLSIPNSIWKPNLEVSNLSDNPASFSPYETGGMSENMRQTAPLIVSTPPNFQVKLMPSKLREVLRTANTLDELGSSDSGSGSDSDDDNNDINDDDDVDDNDHGDDADSRSDEEAHKGRYKSAGLAPT